MKKEKVIKKIWEFDLHLVAVHPYKKIFLLFTPTGIFAFGEPKEIKKCKFHTTDYGK